MTTTRAVLAIDQGTTGSTALVIDASGHVLGRGYSEFTQHYPKPGWVEHDAEEIWRVTRDVAREAAGSLNDVEIEAVGITNQRETVVMWDRETLEPVHRAIVWQDRRTADFCAELKGAGREPWVRERTGLVLDPYFSGTKVTWLLRERPELRPRAESGELAVGTIDSWLLARLTGGSVHATDPTNASRTLLFDLRSRRWNPELLDLFEVPAALLPEVRPSGGSFGVATGDALGFEAPVLGIAGDQQAALFGQGCWSSGLAKNTYGTGAFLLLHTGDRPVASKHGLLTTVACAEDGGAAYALEGSVFIAGAAIQWLRDGLGIVGSAAESEELAAGLDGNEGVYFVPAFVGLGAPYWEPEARGTIVGLTRGTTTAHLVRAALESIAYRTAEVLEAMESDSGVRTEELRVDGGASANDWLLQFQADLLDRPVRRPEMVETTALGAAGLAGLQSGLWPDGNAFLASQREGGRFTSEISDEERSRRLAGWKRAIRTASAWAADR